MSSAGSAFGSESMGINLISGESNAIAAETDAGHSSTNTSGSSSGMKPGTTPSAKTTGSVNISIKWAD